VKLVFVIWHGNIGGAERAAVALARHFLEKGVHASLLFVGNVGPLAEAVERSDVPWAELGYVRGSAIARHPRQFADAASALGSDLAILDSFGYAGTVLKLGGYSGTIIGVEHGVLHRVRQLPYQHRMRQRVSRLLGLLGHDAEVALSSYMHSLAMETVHGTPLVTIPHGVSPGQQVMAPSRREGIEGLRIGYAGRHLFGKGIDIAIRAAAHLASRHSNAAIKFTVAGDGPQRQSLEALTRELGAEEVVTFPGWIPDVEAFWANCDVAIAPAHQLAESFGMTVLEAMACGRPAIVSDLGALPELIRSNQDGLIIPPGDARALSAALERYLANPALIEEHGHSARSRALKEFSLDTCAERYLALSHGEPGRV
jgi:glycosyltransferase involved in cell wall biosynthesis